MKNSYPIILTPDSTGYVVDIRIFKSAPRVTPSRKPWKWHGTPLG